MKHKISDLQRKLESQGVDGWLLYDFRHSNSLACQLIELSADQMLTRRFFYWIPVKGIPVKIVHSVETDVLKHLPGRTIPYSSRQELEDCLKKELEGVEKVVMEYSPRNAIPYVSKVDAGTLEVVKGFGIEVLSSADLLQELLCVWTDEQLQTHLEAAEFLDKTVEKTWEWVSSELKKGKTFTEYDLQQFVLGEFKAHQFIADDPPICAVNAHTANPHYSPSPADSHPIRLNDFILIDLSCKKKDSNAVYADITRVAIAASKPELKQQKIFDIVKEARGAAIALLKARIPCGKKVMGWEVDEVCRKVITDQGYGKYFIHRTGHNIGQTIHGNGANLDNFETEDFRRLLPGTCFSVEPGIYLPDEFGVRLEYDVYLPLDGKSFLITGGIQDNIVCLI